MANSLFPTLPRWAYIVLALACMAMGTWASYITLQYFEHGARALETDAALQALAVSAALMFVASEMSAFALAALLTEAQLWARRWMLTGFAVAVLALEVCTIVAVQLALTVGAEMTQGTVQTQEKDLRARIAAIEAGAAAKREDAARLRAAGQLTKASRSSDGATAEQAQTAALYGQLTQVQAQKRPTLTGLLGRDYAIAYAVARGVLVSLGGLVFFGTAGALLRAARARAGAVQAAAAPAPAPAAPAPASYKPAATVTPKPGGVSYSKGAMLAGVGVPLAAMGGAAMAQTAPAAPVTHPAGVLKQAQPAGAGVLKQAHTGATGVPEQAHQQDEKSAAKPARKRAERPAAAVGAKIDTGTTGKAAARYNRVKAAVAAGSLKPSVRAIQAAEGGGTLVVRNYIQQLAADGVIERAGRGYALAKGGAA